MELNFKMALKPSSLLVVKYAQDREDYDAFVALLDKLGQGVVRCMVVLNPKVKTPPTHPKIDLHDHALPPHSLNQFVDAWIHYFTHLLFLSYEKTIDPNVLAIEIEKMNADPMVSGFQYSWEATNRPSLIPFLWSDLFCIKRQMAVDFGVAFIGENGIMTPPQTILLSSYQANRSGYRFYGIPSIPGTPPVHRGEIPQLPDLNRILENYEHSQDHEWNRFVSKFNTKKDQRLRIFFDMVHCVPAYNGTSLCALNLLKRFYYLIGFDHDVTICCSEEFKNFFEFDELFPNWEWVDEKVHLQKHYDVAYVLGQPWKIERIPFFNNQCYSVFFLILDSIAWDCIYIRSGFNDLDRLWKYWSEFSSGLIFISDFSRTIFLNRFPTSRNTPNRTCLLSTSFQDYHLSAMSFDPKEAPEPVLEKGSYYLIFGSFYDHKYIDPTIRIISPMLAENEKMVIIGSSKGPTPPGIVYLHSGNMSPEEITQLFQDAKAILYPSQYEGFGLPIAEALTQDKVVFARDTRLLHELMDQWNGPGAVIPFLDNLDLVEKFKKFQKNDIEDLQLTGSTTEDHNWMMTSQKMLEFIDSVHYSEENQKAVEKRFRTFDLFTKMNPYM